MARLKWQSVDIAEDYIFFNEAKRDYPVLDVTARKDLALGKYFISANGESTIIDKTEWQQMVNALQIRTYEEFCERFAEVCEYFIIQAQYVPFEEVKCS